MATEELVKTTGIATHGAARLPSVDVDSLNIEMKDEDGFLGDRASKGAFREILDRWRKPLRKTGEDPFGKEPSEEVSKKTLDAILVGDDVEASAVVHSAIEDFAQELAYVTRRFLKSKAWAKTERIVVGGGFRDSRLGELAIARAEIILKSEDFKIDMMPIRHHPDEAGLIGALHLAPSWIFEAYDSILAVDIGGTNIRCGLVETGWKKAKDLSKAKVVKSELWRSCRRRADARRRSEAAHQDAEGADHGGRGGRLQAGTLHRHRLSRRDRRGRLDRERRAEPAGQLGEQQVQPAGEPDRGHS
ncbi:hypothetical protein ACVWW5_008134 [Bradyrhizobium sp. LM3.4]